MQQIANKLPVEEISVVSNINIGFDFDHVIKPMTQ